MVYRRAGGLCAARSFPLGTSAGHDARAPASAGDPRAVVHLPELHAVLRAFPHDRKLAALPRLADPASLLPGCVDARVVAYAAERRRRRSAAARTARSSATRSWPGRTRRG